MGQDMHTIPSYIVCNTPCSRMHVPVVSRFLGPPPCLRKPVGALDNLSSKPFPGPHSLLVSQPLPPLPPAARLGLGRGPERQLQQAYPHVYGKAAGQLQPPGLE